MLSCSGRLFMTYFTGLLGGIIFYFLHLPLPWILGSLMAMIAYKFTFSQKVIYSTFLKNISYVILGIEIGNTFTDHTFQLISPYVVPYLLFSVMLIAISLLFGFLISKIIRLDAATGMLGAVPGGLSAMIALSDSIKSNTVYVTIFHTVRLLAVLFIVPFAAVHFFAHGETGQRASLAIQTDDPLFWTVFAYPLFFYLAYHLRNRVPANYILIPMLSTAFLNIAHLPAYPLPDVFSIGAQVMLGVYLGQSVSVKELIKSGRYVLIFCFLSMVVIGLSFIFGYLFHLMTSLDMATSMLSIAPGGLVEMALTAQTAGGDPSVVGSLQTIRVLMIVLILPLMLPHIPGIKGRSR